jgi:hypothetical protein
MTLSNAKDKISMGDLEIITKITSIHQIYPS